MKLRNIKNISPNKELLIIAFFITKPTILKKIREMWAKKSHISKAKIIGRSKKDTLSITSENMGGELILLDPDNINRNPFAKMDVKTPMGLYYSNKNKTLFTGSDHWIYEIKHGQIIRTLNNRYFNCIHGISKSIDDKLLVASTGIDAILKIDTDNPEIILDSWFATENGYSISANGKTRYIDRGIVYQGNDTYNTREHTTHLNSVLEYSKNKLLVTFFHQGSLIEIDLNTGKTKTILSGMKNPHNIRKTSFGYIVSDTNGKRIIKLNNKLKKIGEITGNYNWIQDSLELKNKDFVIADSNNGRIVIVDGLGTIKQEYNFGSMQKTVGSLYTITAKEANNIFF